MPKTIPIESVPEVASWRDFYPTVDDWLTGNGNFELALAFAHLYWPEFEIHQECVFRGGLYDREVFENWMKVTEGNTQAVENVMNHLHVLDLFDQVSTEPSEELVIELGNKLQAMWQAKVLLDFPNRNIVVEFLSSEIEDLLDYQLIVFHGNNSS